jgi:hypothetical protein
MIAFRHLTNFAIGRGCYIVVLIRVLVEIVVMVILIADLVLLFTECKER